ncbi:uncharacterized protein LOC111615736, partial [Centruroides sculpturatus]|uniref:uncharacterized protein LOC111615736 n=1 Tax=Centruroides sculpturatus TaxID=218467 RepID=UPI000C6CF01E
MPKMGNTVKSVILSEWHVAEGQVIKKGAPFFSYETDKTQVEHKAQEEGTVLKILVEPNQEIAVFSPVAIVGKAGEDIRALLAELEPSETPKVQTKHSRPVPADEPPQLTPVRAAPAPESVSSPAAEPTDQVLGSNRSGFSPRALRTLRRSGINPALVNPAQPNQPRLVSQDVLGAMQLAKIKGAVNQVSQPDLVEQLASEAPRASGDSPFDYQPMRRAIARAMLKSKEQSAAATLVISVDASNLTKVHQRFKKAAQSGGPRISINDLVVFATSRVLPKYSQTINAHVFDERAVGHRHAHIAIAVDTPGGLIVPVLTHANAKSLREISEQARQMIKLVRQGQYQAVDLKSGTFTISNVGALGIESFTPILNDGQAAILGVGALTLRARQNQAGLVEFYQALTLSLTIDHRLVDGADGGRFLVDLKTVLEKIDQ